MRQFQRPISKRHWQGWQNRSYLMNDLHYFVCCLAEAKQSAGDEPQQEKQSGRGCDLLTAGGGLVVDHLCQSDTTNNERPCASDLGLKISVLPAGPRGMGSLMAIARQVYARREQPCLLQH